MLLSILISHVQHYPELQPMSLTQVTSFLSVCTRLRRHIDILQPAELSREESAPDVLPPSIIEFLAAYLGATETAVRRLWDVLKGVAWAEPSPEERQREEFSLFEHHGHPAGLSMFTL